MTQVLPMNNTARANWWRWFLRSRAYVLKMS